MRIELPDDFAVPPGFIQPQTIENMEDQLKKLTFPDRFTCYVRSEPGEVALIYNEVIVQQEYFQNGLSVAGARCVIDIGANIGVFTMAVKLKAPDAILYAFEPIPETFQVLEQNVRLLECSDVHLFNLAIGSQDHSEKTFTFFPNMPGNSTAIPALKEENKPVMYQMFWHDRRAEDGLLEQRPELGSFNEDRGAHGHALEECVVVKAFMQQISGDAASRRAAGT